MKKYLVSLALIIATLSLAGCSESTSGDKLPKVQEDIIAVYDKYAYKVSDNHDNASQMIYTTSPDSKHLSDHLSLHGKEALFAGNTLTNTTNSLYEVADDRIEYNPSILHIDCAPIYLQTFAYTYIDQEDIDAAYEAELELIQRQFNTVITLENNAIADYTEFLTYTETDTDGDEIEDKLAIRTVRFIAKNNKTIIRLDATWPEDRSDELKFISFINDFMTAAGFTISIS